MGLPIRLTQLTHEYGSTAGTAAVRALREIDLEIDAGEFVILMGPSGSGKSTLLNIIGGVERPSAGAVVLGETDITRLGEHELTLLRRVSIGFVFQFFHLLPSLDLKENVELPLALAGVPAAEVRERSGTVLQEIGLEDRASHYPSMLSGGEMQRAAIGRGIIHRPGLLLADEPTGNLDSRTGDQILDLIRQIHLAYRPTIIMATHSEHAASFGDYVLDISDGQVSRRASPA